MELKEALDIIYNKFGANDITVEDWKGYRKEQKSISLLRVKQGINLRKQAGNLDKNQEKLEKEAVTFLENSIKGEKYV